MKLLCLGDTNNAEILFSSVVVMTRIKKDIYNRKACFTPVVGSLSLMEATTLGHQCSFRG